MTWILMVVVFGSGPIEKAYIPFPDAKTCGDALPLIHNGLLPAYPEAALKCEDSGVAKVRPRQRP